MTRAAMRAMDAVIDFVGSPVGGNANIDSFMVSGGSKRGWTTWLAAATDTRVTFAVPIVADLLNMQLVHSGNRQHRSASHGWGEISD